MSEVCLVVREAGRDWSGHIHGSCADQAIAALSADPVTLAELEAATARFQKPTRDHRFYCNLSPGLRDEPYDAGLVVIDLVARLIVVESTYSSPSLSGEVWYHDGQVCSRRAVPYHLAPDWRIMNDATDWQANADARRSKRASETPLDARAVLYGRPLVEFLARETWAAFARRDEIAAAARAKWAENARQWMAKDEGVDPEVIDPSRLTDEAITPKTYAGDEVYASPYYDGLRGIHAAWLLTPRADLHGASPRAVALAQHHHLGMDLHHRWMQWSILGFCPPQLGEQTFAYRYAGFGTNELVKYYDLVRTLLWACWSRLEELAPVGRELPVGLTVEDFLTREVPRLERIRDEWFDTPDPECHGRTPRSIMTRERARIPEVMGKQEALHDPDCPCCQMISDMPGPMLWGLDGCNMDDDFAFDLHHATREEWEEEQRRDEESYKRLDAEREERERLGVSGSESDSIWSSKLSVGEVTALPLGIRIFRIGCRLAELIAALRGEVDRESTPAAVQQLIDELNRGFSNFRELLQTSETSLAAALLDPARERFAETLAAVSHSRPDLVEHCESLASDLARMLDPPPEEPEEPDWLWADSDEPT